MTLENNISIQKTVEKEQKKLFNFIRKRVNSVTEAEDILQDVFYQLVRVSDDINSIEKITSWLFTVAGNKIKDFYRKKKSLSFSQMAKTSEEGEVEEFYQLLPDLSKLPDDEIMRGMVWETLEEGLQELPENQRSVFVMNELEGRSFKEISELTGETVNTLLSRKRYAVLHLREKLKDLYDEIVH